MSSLVVIEAPYGGGSVTCVRSGPMLLVPRQLQRVGMTGDVPYYGGRFTPAQAYAISHPRQVRPVATAPPADSTSTTREALVHLRDVGVLTAEEYHRYLARSGA